MKCLLKIAPIFFILNYYSQTSLDSLYNIWKDSNQSDTSRLIAINKFIWAGYLFKQPDSAYYYTQLQYDFAKKKGLKKHQALALNTIGIYYFRRGNLILAIDNYLNGLKLREEIGDKKGVASSLSNIAIVYSDLHDYNKALEYNLKSLKIREGLRDKSGTATSLLNIGALYNDIGKYDSALIYFNKCLLINQEINNLEGEAISLHNIGNIKKSKGEYEEAIEYINKSIRLKTQLGDNFGVAISLVTIGHIYKAQKKYRNSITLAKQALHISKKVGSIEQIRNASGLLYQNYKALGDNNSALNMYETFIRMRDSIESMENHKEVLNQKYKYEYDKKAATDSLSRVKEMEISKSQLEKKEVEINAKRSMQYALIVGLILVLAFTGFLFNRYKITQKQKHIIAAQKHLVDEKHKEITDSINYAERIQRSFLASNVLLNENLKEHFIFFKPKDIVSGDFYWAEKLSNGKFALVTADSTGHGVPGAIMSILNISSLERSIEQGIIEPKDILNHTRKIIIERLKKDGSKEGGKDGMDCSLIVLDLEKNMLTYSAANNPIWIIRNNSLMELDPDKMPVGKHDRDSTSFNQSTIQLHKDDMIYTLTDGMPDQFGGPKGKKYMYKRLKEFLLSISTMPIDNQLADIELEFNNWKGQVEQVDDVTLIGIRV